MDNCCPSRGRQIIARAYAPDSRLWWVAGRKRQYTNKRPDRPWPAKSLRMIRPSRNFQGLLSAADKPNEWRGGVRKPRRCPAFRQSPLVWVHREKNPAPEACKGLPGAFAGGDWQTAAGIFRL